MAAQAGARQLVQSPAGNTAAAMPPLRDLMQTPGLRQLSILVGLAASVAIGVTAAFWMRAPGYSTLYANVSDKEAGEVVGILGSAGIPYELDTGAITVPSGKLYEARLKLAENGLPRSSGFGLEIIENQTGLATSQFMEGARYHHALETELSRTISSLQTVQGARVHLALPKSTVFIGRKQPPSASVLLQLYSGRSLPEAQVASIVHLVASSIPELEAGRVTVVDQHGRLLSSPEDTTALGLNARQLDYIRRIEQSYVERIERLLTPMLGPGRVRATVNADVDFTQREETQEMYAPDAVLRSEQVSEDRRAGGPAAAGIPGALSNQPPEDPVVAQAAGEAAPGVAGAAAPLNESLRRTRNFEVDRTLSHTRHQQGALRRVSVAVLVDDKAIVAEDGSLAKEKLSAEELAELAGLVREAVGFDEQRGDSVSLSNVSFYQAPPAELADEPGLLASPGAQDMIRQGLGALLILGVALLLVRPLLRVLGGPPAAPQPAMAVAADAPPGADGALSFDDKVTVARQLASHDPERVARIVRAWMQTDG